MGRIFNFAIACVFAFAVNGIQANTFVIKAKVVSVYDGDTFRVDIEGQHPVFGKKLPVRIRGIDTPEIRGCTKKQGVLSKGFLIGLLKESEYVVLHNIGRGKYFRLVADVFVNGRSVSKDMLHYGFAKPYTGKTSKPKWSCDDGR